MDFRQITEWATRALELAGLVVIVVGAALSAVGALVHAVRRREAADAYHRLRLGIGRTILLGLELLIAADIIRTIAIAPTFENVASLGLIVLIRTFLSVSIEVELGGRWPWRAREVGDVDAEV